MTRHFWTLLLSLCMAAMLTARGQLPVGVMTGDTPVQHWDSLASRAPLPFTPGERLDYTISFGPIHVGTGSMQLTHGDTLRGQPTYHAVFRIQGGTLFFKVADRIESWFTTDSFASLKFTQSLHEGRYHAERNFDIYPSQHVYVPVGDTARPSVAEPLDDASFLYFVRTLPLVLGATYRFDRYFQVDGNPVVIRVVRRERITVPAGTFDAIVVQPQITTGGIFSKNGRAEVWLRADGAHEVLQMKSHLAFGSINLYLTREGAGTP
jgi:uncharacterized protein DUF3108